MNCFAVFTQPRPGSPCCYNRRGQSKPSVLALPGRPHGFRRHATFRWRASMPVVSLIRDNVRGAHRRQHLCENRSVQRTEISGCVGSNGVAIVLMHPPYQKLSPSRHCHGPQRLRSANNCSSDASKWKAYAAGRSACGSGALWSILPPVRLAVPRRYDITDPVPCGRVRAARNRRHWTLVSSTAATDLQGGHTA